MSSQIYRAQDRIVSLLAADEFFTDPDPTKVIAVLSQRHGDLANELARVLSDAGIGVTVMLPVVGWEGRGINIALGLRFTIFVSENPVVNQTTKRAEDVMEKIFKILQWKPNGAINSTNPMHQASKFQIGNPAARLMAPTKDHPTILNYALTINTIVTLV